jgi:hypothetical protein
MSYFARLTLAEGKGIAARALNGKEYEMRLLKDGRGLSGVVTFTFDEFPFIGHPFHHFERGGIKVSYDSVGWTFLWKGKEFAKIHTADFTQLLTEAKAINEGRTATPKETFERNSVQIVQVAKN